ncbi:hypothetical protein lerEdw1_017253 [Lerista edwardsae]|nr:hypothetical protein lerEdw1_017253 [Lerista edwardsae]
MQRPSVVTQSDCYVTLRLPTASVKRTKTSTVNDNKDPVWNETFHYRIQNEVKNILELEVCDEDRFTDDDHLLTVFFDVSKIQLGETCRLSFQLNPKGKEELEVEFTLESSPDVPENIFTNGVLVVILLLYSLSFTTVGLSREVACLEVQVDGGRKKTDESEHRYALSVGGSHEESQNLTLRTWLCPAAPAKFHYVKFYQSELDVELRRRQLFADPRDNESTTVQLLSLPLQEQVTIAPNKTFDLNVQSKDWTQGWLFKSPKGIDVRLGYDLCSDERSFLQRRKKVVSAALNGILHLGQNLPESEVPVVAVTTTGSGMRALTAMYGTLWGLQRLKLLDCISYITGSSGTTWAMSHLYEDSNWSNKDLGEIIKKARIQAAKSKTNAFSLESLKKYTKELSQRTAAGYMTSFIDLWGLMLEAMLNDENNNHKLSDQRKAVNRGQNPLPVYLALNVKDNFATRDFREWVEFTPYEVGFLKYGAFVRPEDFGSQFYMGHLMKKLPESRICFMQGMWSSVFSKNLLDAWQGADNSEDFWNRWTQDNITEIDTALDDSPNRLRDAAEHMELVDTAFFFDTSCPPLLRPERKVDVILHFNYTGGSQAKPLEQAARYFSEQGIPYPNTQLSDEDKKDLKECYVFEDEQNPEAPIVIYFPLVNDTFQRYLAPGIERNASEMSMGNIDLSGAFSPYSTRQVSLPEEDFNKLLNLTNYNVQNNAGTIVHVLHKAIELKRQAHASQTSS